MKHYSILDQTEAAGYSSPLHDSTLTQCLTYFNTDISYGRIDSVLKDRYKERIKCKFIFKNITEPIPSILNKNSNKKGDIRFVQVFEKS